MSMDESILIESIEQEKLNKIVQEITFGFQKISEEAIKVTDGIIESMRIIMRSLNPTLKSLSDMINRMIREEEENEHLRQEAIQLHLVSKKVISLSYRGGKVGNKNMNRIKKQMFYYYKRNSKSRTRN